VIARATLAATLAVLANPAQAAAPVTGHWVTAGRDSVIEIAPCGGQICGRIAKLLRPVPDGPPVDRNNPNASLRNRPLVGLPILTNFTDAGSSWSGSIYDPRHGKTYRSVVARNADGTLKVQGCIAFFCQTQVWTRAQ
jgi:uncharacterized protein (DUF2147 family)